MPVEGTKDLQDLSAAEFIEQMRDAVMLVDLYGKIIACNQALCERVGYPREELVGASPSIWHQDNEGYGELTREIISHALDDGWWLGNISFRSTSGEVKMSEVMASPFRDQNGRIIAILSVSRDISGRGQRME